MKPPDKFRHLAKNHPRIGMPSESGGYYEIGKLRIIASWTEGWDHVSVSLPDRCPTWEEMERVKRYFFHSSEVAMQLHVGEANHISLHNFCLHIWRPQNATIPLPPPILVGF